MAAEAPAEMATDFGRCVWEEEMTTDRRCGTCKYLHVAPDKAGRRVVRKDGAYRCTFEPGFLVLPDSLTERSSGWSGTRFKLPTAGYMEGTEGIECPVWEELKR